MLDSKIECEKRGIGTKEGEQKVEQEVKVAECGADTFWLKHFHITLRKPVSSYQKA